MYNVREANIGDRQAILKFIESNWNGNHIFVKDEKIFDYYHLENEKINFIIAEEDGDITATLGYLKYNALSAEKINDVFTVIWKSCNNSMAGIKCLEYLMNKGYKSISSCGINKKTEAIYKFLGCTTGKLNQWYILNSQLKNEEYRIAKIQNNKQMTFTKSDNRCIVRLNEHITEQQFNQIQQKGFEKSYHYFMHKYINHPYYNYGIYSVKKGEKIKTLVITREISINAARCLRIIDLIGDVSYLKEMNLQAILEKNQYEYIDFYEVGMDKELLEKMGLVLREDQDENIIPNYFEPFEQKNIEIYFMTNTKEEFCMFKGDGDQDRPSIAKEQNLEK